MDGAKKVSVLVGIAGMLFASLVPSAASAHSAAEKAAVLRGGVAAATENFNLELVATDGDLKLYIRDRRNHPVDAHEYAGTALVWCADKTMTLDFRPTDAGILKTQGEFSLAVLQRVIVTVTAPGYESETAWFTGFDNHAD